MPRELIEPHKDDKRYVRRKKGKFSTRQTEVDRCRNHVNKQQAGILSFAMRVVTDPGGLLDTYLTVRGARNGTRRGCNLSKPDKLFRLNGTSSVCLRFTQITAHVYVQDAANDYSGQWDRYTNPCIYKPDDPELYTALESWPGRPTLASPERPLLPPWMTLKLPA
jgi:hypothetical protein